MDDYFNNLNLTSLPESFDYAMREREIVRTIAVYFGIPALYFLSNRQLDRIVSEMKRPKQPFAFGHDLPPLDDPFTCEHCGFEGTYMDTYERRFRESEGVHVRGGTRFTCKKCNGVVLEVINLRS